MGRVRAWEGRNVLFYFGIDVIPERIKVVPVVARKIQLSLIGIHAGFHCQ